MNPYESKNTPTIKVFVVALNTIRLFQSENSPNPFPFDVHLTFFVAKME